MAANLTAGVVTKMLSGEVTSEKEIMPILQLTDLKLVLARIQGPHQNPELSRERYRIALSDGISSIEGIFNSPLNILVKQGNIQLGSILRLTIFVCNVVQGKRLVLVSNVDVIAERFDAVGNVQTRRPDDPVQSSIDQRGGAVSANTQRVGGFEQQQAIKNEMNGGRQINTGRFGVANSPQPQVSQRPAYGAASGSGFPETSPSTRPYGSPNAGYGSSRQEQIRAPAPQTAYSRPVQSGYHQPQPPSRYVNSGPVARNEDPPRTIPISALNPYQGRWTIKVRVTSKGELRRFNSTRGDGKVFSFDLVDADGGEIRVTCFNEVVDQFFDQIVVGNVYLITKGSLKPARKEYNHLPNDYEIHLDNASTIQQCYEDDAAIPRNKFHFRDIGDIEHMESNSITDLIGIVSSISPTGTIMRKNGTEAQKRALQLKDMSGRSVEVTMWGNFCSAEGQRLQSLCDSGVFPVLAVKAGRISEFNGKQVSTIGSSQLFIEPDLPEARELREWYERVGRNAPCVSISREFSGAGRQEVRKFITEIKDEKLGTSEKPDWITVSATISFMKIENFCYTACPIMIGDRPCSKKVTNNGDGTWRCERCDKCSNDCDYRYILQLQLQDHTGVTWATAFQEAGEEIMGLPAKDLYYIKNEDQDEEKFEGIIRNVTFTKYIFKLKIKEETYSDEQRVKATVVKAEKLNYSSDTRSMLEAMDKLRAEDANPESSNYRSDAFNSGIGTSGTRETLSVDARRDFGLPAANQVGQNGNHYSSGAPRPLGGITICGLCGGSGHVSENCPTLMSEPQGQYMSGTLGRYTGGGMPRQHVGNY
uniref:Replication protein A subunit n=1 Tax=Noccaea caerulescens TaxID=107243 RepID=A0A1J3K0V5_NOCCA